MSAFFLAFLAAALVIAAGRDALFVARLSQAHARAPGIYGAIVLAALAFAALSGWLAQSIAALLDARSGQLFVAAALLIAAGEVVFLTGAKAPAEPTQSTFATTLVLASRLVTGAAGFVVLALAARAVAPWQFTAMGGACGALAALSAAALAGEDWERLPLRAVRWAAGAGLAGAAFVIALSA